MRVCVLSVFTLILAAYVEYTHTDICSGHTVHPESVLVEYGTPVKLTCSITTENATKDNLGWEGPFKGDTEYNGNSAVLTHPNLTEWDVNENNIMCYYKTPEPPCIENVDLKIYKRPDHVRVHSEPGDWLEGQNKSLSCDVKNVGPVESLIVQWIRMDQNKTQMISNASYEDFNFDGKKTESGNVTVSLEVQSSREEDGVQYQCAALLKLTQLLDPQVGISEPLNITVLYKPTIRRPPGGSMSLTRGDPLRLDCSADGNPRPEYVWTSPGNQTHPNSTFIIQSVQSEHEGNYSCTASNSQGSDTVTVSITVVEDYVVIVAVCAAVAVLLLVLVLCIKFCAYYRHHHMGRYILKSLTSRRNNGNVAHGDTDQSEL